MKLISTGGTGLIGRGALKQALAHPDVTEVIALVRRPIEDDSITRNRKVKQVIVADGDFLHYDEKVVEACQGAVGCVWGVGNGANMKASAEEKRKVLFEYPRAFIDRIAIPNGRANGKPFRMCWVGGQIMELDQNRSLWLLGGPRKEMGRMATSMLEHARSNLPHIEFYVANCGYAYEKPSLTVWLISMFGLGAISTEQLGRAMVALAMEGGDKKILWNQDLVELGDEVTGQWRS